MTKDEFQALPYSGSAVRHTPSGLACVVVDKHPAGDKPKGIVWAPPYDCVTVKFPRGAVVSIDREMLAV